MQRIGILGPESSGKSTLGQYLARRYDFVTYIPEYARTYLETRNTPGASYSEINHMAQHTLELIKQGGPRGVLFDTELLYYRIWFDHAYGHHPEWLDEAIDRWRMDCYLLCYPDLEWHPDPTRENGSDAIRLQLYEEYRAAIEALDIPYYIIRHCS